MNIERNFITRALQPDLLGQPFALETKWNVITGAPCAGKTTILHALQDRGFQWHPEIARSYIEERLAQGETLSDIRKDEAKFQCGLINAKVALENSCDSQQSIFFDRAMPDSITYYRVAGLDPNQVLHDCFRHKYAGVFIFDPLPFEADNARTESASTIDFLNKWLELDYQALGYNVIRVPVMPIEQRLSFILQRVIA